MKVTTIRLANFVLDAIAGFFVVPDITGITMVASVTSVAGADWRTGCIIAVAVAGTCIELAIGVFHTIASFIVVTGQAVSARSGTAVVCTDPMLLGTGVGVTGIHWRILAKLTSVAVGAVAGTIRTGTVIAAVDSITWVIRRIAGIARPSVITLTGAIDAIAMVAAVDVGTRVCLALVRVHVADKFVRTIVIGVAVFWISLLWVTSNYHHHRYQYCHDQFHFFILLKGWYIYS